VISETDLGMNDVKMLHGWLPKIIHQTYRDHQLPSWYEQNIARIKELCPGWEYRFYDNQDIQNYISRNFPDYLGYYNRIDKAYGAARADFFRYLVLFNEGGVYLDIKSSITKPLDEVLPREAVYLLSHWQNGPGEKYEDCGLFPALRKEPEPWPDRGEFQQWFIVAPPRHPFLQRTIERVCENIDKYRYFTGATGGMGVLRLTGPIAYTRAILSLMDTVEHSIVDAETDLGFRYTILPGMKSHRSCSGYKHYSKQKIPIIKPEGAMIIFGFLGRPLACVTSTTKRIRKSITKRANKLINKSGTMFRLPNWH